MTKNIKKILINKYRTKNINEIKTDIQELLLVFKKLNKENFIHKNTYKGYITSLKEILNFIKNKRQQISNLSSIDLAIQYKLFVCCGSFCL